MIPEKTYVLVTRAEGDEDEIISLFNSNGIGTLFYPVLEYQAIVETSEIQHTLNKLKDFNWVLFPSAHAVTFFFKTNSDNFILSHLKFITIGPKTTQKLKEFGFDAVITPKKFSSNDFLKEYKNTLSGTILIIKSSLSNTLLEDELNKAGIKAAGVVFYETVMRNPSKNIDLTKQVENFNIISFTSPSSVKNLLSMCKDQKLFEKTALCIGPSTKEEAVKSGFKKVLMAEVYTVEGMVEKLSKKVRKF